MSRPIPRIWPFLLAVACGFVGGAAAGAESSDWMSRTWQLDDGLPGNSVTGIAQTPDGYLWVATEGGLARFDGAHFESIAVPIPSGRTRPIIRAMLLGQDNQLWLAMEGGHVMAMSNQSTHLFTKANGLSGVRCENMVQDGENIVWTSHSDGGVCRIANGQVTRFANRNGPEGNGSCFLTTDLKGQVWFSRRTTWESFAMEPFRRF